jgi:hypothetical protein
MNEAHPDIYLSFGDVVVVVSVNDQGCLCAQTAELDVHSCPLAKGLVSLLTVPRGAG